MSFISYGWYILDSTNPLIFGEKNPTEKGAKKNVKNFRFCLPIKKLFIYLQCRSTATRSLTYFLSLSYVPLDCVKVYLICITLNFHIMDFYKNKRLTITYFSINGKLIAQYNFHIVNKSHFNALLKKYAVFTINRDAVFSLGVDNDVLNFIITFRDK